MNYKRVKRIINMGTNDNARLKTQSRTLSFLTQEHFSFHWIRYYIEKRFNHIERLYWTSDASHWHEMIKSSRQWTIALNDGPITRDEIANRVILGYVVVGILSMLKQRWNPFPWRPIMPKQKTLQGYYVPFFFSSFFFVFLLLHHKLIKTLCDFRFCFTVFTPFQFHISPFRCINFTLYLNAIS